MQFLAFVAVASVFCCAAQSSDDESSANSMLVDTSTEKDSVSSAVSSGSECQVCLFPFDAENPDSTELNIYTCCHGTQYHSTCTHEWIERGGVICMTCNAAFSQEDKKMPAVAASAPVEDLEERLCIKCSGPFTERDPPLSFLERFPCGHEDQIHLSCYVNFTPSECLVCGNSIRQPERPSPRDPPQQSRNRRPERRAPPQQSQNRHPERRAPPRQSQNRHPERRSRQPERPHCYVCNGVIDDQHLDSTGMHLYKCNHANTIHARCTKERISNKHKDCASCHQRFHKNHLWFKFKRWRRQRQQAAASPARRLRNT